MPFPSSPTQALRPSSAQPREGTPTSAAWHSKSALRSADDCISQRHRTQKVQGPARVSQPGPGLASWLQLSAAPLLGQGCLPTHPSCPGRGNHVLIQFGNSQIQVPFQLRKIPLPTRDKKVGGRTGVGLLLAFQPATADGLEPDLQPKENKKRGAASKANILEFSKT